MRRAPAAGSLLRRALGALLAGAALVALSGCVIVQHPDATLGSAGPLATSAAGTCAPSTATYTDLRLSDGPDVLVLAERASFVDGKQTNPAIVRHAGSALQPSTTVKALGGDADAWIGAISTAAAHELTLPPGFGDDQMLEELGRTTQFPTVQTTTGSFVYATVSASSALAFRVLCPDGRAIDGRVLSPSIQDERMSVIVECDASARSSIVASAPAASRSATRLALRACDSAATSVPDPPNGKDSQG